MKKVLYRLLLLFYSKFFSTDNLSQKYAISVKGVISDENRILLLKNERNEWDFPGGKLDKNDTIKETLIREVKEELNLDIIINDLIHLENYTVNGINVLIIIYNVSINSSDFIKLSYEHTNFNFFKRDMVKKLKKPEWVTKLF